ncbi:hypothetical protein PQX77_013184 [Marasmius sp. AFHP31]|nr:hypothetical protein PQX77_013184 [Marasmius sp. AFHP31]
MNTRTPRNIIESAINNDGNRNVNYQNCHIQNTHNDSPAERSPLEGPQRSGIEILADYTAPTALHSSDTRNARTACLAGTRVGIVDKLTSWIEDPSKKHRVCWVTGGAGVGKSAIAQTICETFRRKSRLAASFFFSRSDTSRSTLDPFFPTLAHQLATSAAFRNVGLSSLIDHAVRENPGELRRTNLEGQFQLLISQPCVQIDAKKWKELPKLIVIDGLDECMGGSDTISASQAQETLLSIINNATIASSSFPLQFMIFSRPEHTIRNFFQTTLSHEPVDTRDFNEEADRDIRTYLTKKFSALSDSQPEVLAMGGWPTKEVRNMLVRKADGHFIYVVTVMKYITSNHPSPAELRERLEIVLHTEETTSHPDLSDLDQLYHTILRRFGNGDLQTKLLLPLLQFIITPHELLMSIRFPSRDQHLIAALMKIDFHHCSTLLSQLRSVLHVPDDPHNGDVTVLHASFSDFLGDGHRSHEFQVQPLPEDSYIDHFYSCLLFVLNRQVHQHQRGEHIDPKDWTRLDLRSLDFWEILNKRSSQINAREEGLSAINNFDLYGHSNMILDSAWAKKTFRGWESMKWKEEYSFPFDSQIHRNSQYHKHRIGPAAKRREFFNDLFMKLLEDLFYIRKVYADSKSDGRTLRYNYFEDDWLIILPKDKKNRKISLSRLGCIAALGSAPWPDSTVPWAESFLKRFPRAVRDSWSIPSSLNMLPYGDLEQARSKFSGDKFVFCLVRRQQREQFGQELVKSVSTYDEVDDTWTLRGRLTIPNTVWNNRLKILTSTTSETPQPSGERKAVSRASRGLFRIFS